MTHKQIEASRETRLWIAQIIIPALTCVGIAMANPGIRNTVKSKIDDFKYRIKVKTNK